MGNSQDPVVEGSQHHCQYCGVDTENEAHDRHCPDRKKETIKDYVPTSVRRMVVWTEDDLKEFRRRIRQFKKDPEAYAEFLEDGVIMHTLILNKLVLEPPPGRIGAQIVAGAIKEFRGIADEVHSELLKKAAERKARERGTKKE